MCIYFCDENDLVILNGRFVDDFEGEFTFVGPMGCSVNDLCCVSYDCLPQVERFSVLSETFSDHLPLSVYVNLHEASNDPLPLLPQLIWLDSALDVYRANLEVALTSIIQFPENAQDYADAITSCIKKASPIPSCSASFIKSYQKKPWFNFKCLRARSRSFRCLNLFRKTNSIIAKDAYLQAKKDYVVICTAQRKEY